MLAPVGALIVIDTEVTYGPGAGGVIVGVATLAKMSYTSDEATGLGLRPCA